MKQDGRVREMTATSPQLSMVGLDPTNQLFRHH